MVPLPQPHVLLKLIYSLWLAKSEWCMCIVAEKEHDGLERSSRAFVHDKEIELATIKESLNRLVTIYVNQEIDRESFLTKKEELLSRKKALQESIEQNESGVSKTWLEPFTEWIQTARTLGNIAKMGSPQEKKEVASKVFGSNLFLDCKKARGSCVQPWSPLVENSSRGGMVGWQGLEPWTNALKGHCSTN